MEERRNETQNGSNDRTTTIIELMFSSMIFAPPFIFWFTAVMGSIGFVQKWRFAQELCCATDALIVG